MIKTIKNVPEKPCKTKLLRKKIAPFFNFKIKKQSYVDGLLKTTWQIMNSIETLACSMHTVNFI